MDEVADATRAPAGKTNSHGRARAASRGSRRAAAIARRAGRVRKPRIGRAVIINNRQLVGDNVAAASQPQIHRLEAGATFRPSPANGLPKFEVSPLKKDGPYR